MEINDVSRVSAAIVSAETGVVEIHFKILGALKSFEFPFSNESVTEKKIIFVRRD